MNRSTNAPRLVGAAAAAVGLVAVAVLGANAAGAEPEPASGSGSGSADGPRPEATVELRAITHNICGSPCHGGDPSATDALLEQIGPDRFDPHIVMLQEVCFSQYEHLMAELGDGYAGDFSPMVERTGCGGDSPEQRQQGQVLIAKGTMANADVIDLDGDSYGNDGKDYTALCYDLTLTDVDLAAGKVKACSTHIRAFKDELWHVRARWAQLGKLAAEMDDDLFADDQVVVLGGDLNTTPEQRSLDPLYQLAADNDPNGLGAFVEADQTDPDLCSDPAPGCRSGDPTKDTRKLDYIFFDAQHARGRLSGGVIPVVEPDGHDHELFRGLAEITVG